MTDKFLEMKNISKRFGGVQALKDVDFLINKGEIHCLVGENGSGKSTLIKIISGVLQPEPGAAIVIEGEEYTSLSSIMALHKGISVIYQDLSLFPNLTVAENIALNQHLEKGSFIDWNKIEMTAREAMQKINLELELDRIVSTLSIADRQLVAICRALAANSRLVIMDEPTASLTSKEVDLLFKVIREMQQKGITILFVSHKLDEIMEISERVTILRDGSKIGTFSSGELDNERVSYLMTGKEITYSRNLPQIEMDKPLLDVQKLSRKGFFRDISFKLYPGEVLGITGLLGSGRTEMALALFGMEPADSGEIYLAGKKIKIRSKEDALKNGIGYVPEDRLTQGLIMDQPISDNLILTVLKRLLNKFNLINFEERNSYIKKWVNNLNIKVPSLDASVKTLSGGNQQRVVLAKWIATDPAILVLDEPTVGVDVAAKESIYEIVRQLTERGIGIILISDEVPEVYYNCHRILIMRSGRIVEELSADEISEKELSQKVNAKYEFSL